MGGLLLAPTALTMRASSLYAIVLAATSLFAVACTGDDAVGDGDEEGEGAGDADGLVDVTLPFATEVTLGAGEERCYRFTTADRGLIVAAPSATPPLDAQEFRDDCPQPKLRLSPEGEGAIAENIADGDAGSCRAVYQAAVQAPAPPGTWLVCASSTFDLVSPVHVSGSSGR